MRNIWTIAVREYKAYFSNFTAYLFAAVMLLVIGGVIVVSLNFTIDSFGQYPPPTVQAVIGPMMFLLVFACPAFSMRLLSEEQRLGTMELLLTAPVRDWELVVGKWFGSFLFVLTLIAVTWVYPVALHLMIDPGIDQGLMISGYLGLVLVAATFLSIGVAVSSFFNSQVTTFIVTFGVIALFWWIVGMFGQDTSGTGNVVLQFLDMSSHFYDNLIRGVVELSAIIYYLSATALGLLIGSVSVEMRRWR